MELTDVDLLGVLVQLRHTVEQREASADTQEAVVAQRWC